MSGVGISFGADRIYDVLTGLDLFPESLAVSTDLLFANMGSAEARWVVGIAAALRRRGISCEVYPDSVKLKKQFDYASRKGIPFLSICGESEMQDGMVNIKNLSSGEQLSFAADDMDGIIGVICKNQSK